MVRSLAQLVTWLLPTALLAVLPAKRAAAASDPFPPVTSAPALESYVTGGVFAHTYYIAPGGDDALGDGSITNPWASVNGARTGGAGTPTAAGDRIYFRGGTYVATEANTSWKNGYYLFDVTGTATDAIVLTAYPNETPVFEAPADGHISLDIKGDYVVVDSLTFTSGSLMVHSASHDVVQNCRFEGDPFDPVADQLNDGHLYACEGAHHLTIRNCTFASVGAHAVKTYASSDMPTNLVLDSNLFLGGQVSYGLVAFKAAITDYEITNNRFVGVGADVLSIGSSYTGSHQGLDIHHNAFDGCTGSILTKLGTTTVGEVQGLAFHANVILGATSGDRVFLELNCEGGVCSTGATARLGEVYDNAFYDLVDVIDPQTTTEFTNYPSFFNYNAYPSTSLRDSAENANAEPTGAWQGSALVQASPGVSRIGAALSPFYCIDELSGFVGAGRDGATIGGFVWGARPRPTAPTNLRVGP